MRFNELVESSMTEAQKAVYREVVAGPRGRLGPPTNVLLRCPQLANGSQKIGEYVRYGSSLPPYISEFAIIIAGRYWSSNYEWSSHCPLAIKGGLDPRIAEHLAQGRRPTGMPEDVAAAYELCTELHRDKEVSDATFATALKHLGENGIVDLVGASGYYTLICMCLRVNQRELPPDVPKPLAPLPNDRVLPPRAGTGASGNTGPDRFPQLSESQMSEAQRAVVNEVTAGGKNLSTPMKVLIRSPELARRAQKISEYLRFGSTIPARIIQFAVIMTARYWRSETMWHAHSKQAMDAGLKASIVADLLQGRHPAGMQPDEEAAYRFCTELHQEKSISDAAFDPAMKLFGEAGTVDLIGVCGYYTLAAMTLKIARKPLP